MPKIKAKTAGKIGLFSAIMMIFGAVVGIGIFFKNMSVFKANNNNAIGVLCSWIIAVIMAMCMAVSFGELVTCKLKNKGDGLGGWASAYCGNQFGRYTKVSQSLNYFPVIIFAVAVFAGEACLNCFSPGAISYGNLSTLFVFLIGLGLFVLFAILNLVASNGMNKFSDVAGIIKFIPLVAVILLGIIFGCLNKDGPGGLWNGHHFYTEGGSFIQGSTGDFKATGMIASIPAILFAFEGYTIIGSIANDMDNPEKNVPLSIVLAMIIISVLNLLITIGCITAGVGSVYDLMHIVFKGNETLIKVFNIIMSIFIFICIIGVLNALTFAGMRALQTNCANGVLFKGKSLIAKKPNNPLFAGCMYLLAIVGFWFIGIGVPSCILNTDWIADGSTNILIIYFYIIYGIILLGSFVNRFKNKVQVNKIKAFPFTVVVGVICCFFIFAYSGIYENLVNPILNPTATTCSWGLFVKGSSLNNWQIAIIFWSLFAFMVCLPLINDGLIKGFDKENKNPLIWQKNNEIVVLQ